MQNYSNEEKFDMLVCYISSHRNANLALQNYANSFPERRQPNVRYFAKLVTNLLNFGSFQSPRVQNYVRNENRDHGICQFFEENPATSTRTAARELNVPKSTVQRTLKKKQIPSL